MKNNNSQIAYVVTKRAYERDTNDELIALVRTHDSAKHALMYDMRWKENIALDARAYEGDGRGPEAPAGDLLAAWNGKKDFELSFLGEDQEHVHYAIRVTTLV